jgi:hypothetical protein
MGLYFEGGWGDLAPLYPLLRKEGSTTVLTMGYLCKGLLHKEGHIWSSSYILCVGACRFVFPSVVIGWWWPRK